MSPKLDSPSYASENELFIVNIGEEKCSPLHAYGPAQRGYFLIHFVISGCGTVQYSNTTVSVHAGQGFLIIPGETTYYQADAASPWHYAWVGYRGVKAESVTSAAGLNENQRVFTAQDPAAIWQILSDLQTDARELRLNQLAATGSLLRFIAHIAPIQDPQSAISTAQSYCEKAKWYLEGNYDRPVSIQETADFVGLSRSHLYRLMMEECGKSPKEMLLHIRMLHARRLLRDTAFSLEEIARLIGLQTGAQFGVAFRQVHGITPGQYRKSAETQPI